MINIIIGEALGTFILIFIGLSCGISNTLISKDNNPIHAGFCWGSAIILSNIIGSNFSKVDLNPIISIFNFLNNKITLQTLIICILSQIIGCYIAIRIIILYYNKISQNDNIGFINAILVKPYDNSSKQNIIIEAIMTFILVLFVYTTSTNKYSILIIALLVCTFIIIGGRVSGTILNPIRDIIPRTYLYYKNPYKHDIINIRYNIVSFIGPLTGMILAYLSIIIYFYLV